MMSRLGAYKTQEKEAHDKCHLELSLAELRKRDDKGNGERQNEGAAK